MQTDDPLTSISLLARLRSESGREHAWGEFVERYGGMLRRWCLHWGLQPSDADDITQTVLLALAKQMKNFEYRPDGKFRGWLKTIAHRAWVDFLENRRRSKRSDSVAIQKWLEAPHTQDDFIYHLDRECERNMLDDAMALARDRVHDTTWTAFYQTAIQGRPAGVVAEELNRSVVAVYRARFRVQTMIRQELDLVGFDNGPDS
ncbi:MAG: sigma-70 family RNA polymerase sigma factor [Planctomycetota bacterium]